MPLTPEELQRRKKINKWLLPVIIILLVGGCTTCMFSDDDDATQTTATKPEPPKNKWDKWQAFHVSAWDGSCIPLERAIKKVLNDPSSYDHAETNYYLNDDTTIITVVTSFRAKNGFGALMLNSYTATYDLNGNLLTIDENK